MILGLLNEIGFSTIPVSCLSTTSNQRHHHWLQPYSGSGLYVKTVEFVPFEAQPTVAAEFPCWMDEKDGFVCHDEEDHDNDLVSTRIIAAVVLDGREVLRITYTSPRLLCWCAEKAMLRNSKRIDQLSTPANFPVGDFGWSWEAAIIVDAEVADGAAIGPVVLFPSGN